jgi:hypothetical protein
VLVGEINLADDADAIRIISAIFILDSVAVEESAY